MRKAIFISGNSVDPDVDEPVGLEPLQEIVAEARLPIFGFCGGFQFIAQALGVALGPLTVHSHSPMPVGVCESPDGITREIGYHPVELIADHDLLAGVEPAPVVRHAHSLEVPVLPDGFTTLASTPVTEIQMAVDDSRRLVGTQFHPEYYTDDHPAGHRMIENFIRWAGIERV